MIVKNVFILGLLLTLTVANDVRSSQYMGWKAHLVEGGYMLEIPPSITVKEESPVHDFILYKFYLPDEDQQILTLYIGNHPQIEGDIQNIEVCRGVVSNYFTARCNLSHSSKGEPISHVYTKLSESEWPQYAHFSYRNDVPERIEELIEGILLTFGPES